MRISDWSSDVCSSDLTQRVDQQQITRRRVVAFRSVAFLDCSEHVGIAARACVETGTCRSFGIARCIDGALERGNALQAGRGFEERQARVADGRLPGRARVRFALLFEFLGLAARRAALAAAVDRHCTTHAAAFLYALTLARYPAVGVYCRGHTYRPY